MSDCDWFTQITQDKWATVSKSLKTNKQKGANYSGSLFCGKLLIHSFAHKKWAICWKIWIKSYVYVCTIFKSFFVSLKKQVSCSFPFFNEWCELSAQAAHDKRVTCRSPKMKEWANCSFFSANRSFTSLRLPMRKFPTLLLDHHFLFQLFNVYITFDICKSCSVAAPSTLDIMKLVNTM